MAVTAAKRSMMEVDEEEDDPIPNELDNALVHLIPAITACGSDPALPSYLNLDTFEKLAGPALRGGDGAAGANDSSSATTTGRRLDLRISGEIEVAFRHCMHEAGLALVGADADIGGGGGSAAGGGRGGRARKGEKEVTAGTGAASALQSEAEAMVKMMSGPLGILSLALKFVSKEAKLDEGGADINPLLSGLPLLLLEDFLESQGRKACKVFWSNWVEPNSTGLTKLLPVKNNAGKYVLIRLCKKLAQRMSKTHDSSFCGQIHLFLANALGFVERSGLNVTGAINHDNITAFEDEEQFRRTMMGFDGEEAGGAAAPGDGSDPMEVDSAGAGAGGKNQSKEQGGGASAEFKVDYPLYQSFWRLQKYTLQQAKAVKGEEAKETWEALLADVDKILGAFEANAFSEHDLRLARERWAAAGSPASSSAVAPSSQQPAASRGAATQPGSSSKRKRGGDRGPATAAADAGAMEVEARGGVAAGGGGGAPVYFGLKYLTSSRLLKLQLRDPTLRLQVLTQWLILAASLKSKVATSIDCPNSVEDLKPRIELAKRLVRATPPRGEEYLGMLQIVLNRESSWTQWKDVKKCKDVEPAAIEEERQAEKDKAAGVVKPGPSYPNKRPRPSAAVALAERGKYAPLGADFPLEKMVAKLRAGVPSSEEHLEDQRMCAEDPDTPASELPSASPLYTWRALRLLGRENPANLVGCYDGDLVKAIERLDTAKKDAIAAEAAAAEAAAAAASAAAAGSAPDQPIKTETACPPETTTEATVAAAAAAVQKTDGEGTEAVDGEEDGEVELKKEAAVAATATDAAAGTSDSGSNAKSGDSNGVAAVAASEEARNESEPVVVPVAATKEETPTPSPYDASPASTPAPPAADGTTAPAAADSDATAATAGKPAAGDGGEDVGGGGGGGGGDGDGSAAAAATVAGATSSPEEPPSSSTTTTKSTKKPGAVEGRMAPAAAKKASLSPPPSPARSTKRKAQNGRGK